MASKACRLRRRRLPRTTLVDLHGERVTEEMAIELCSIPSLVAMSQLMTIDEVHVMKLQVVDQLFYKDLRNKMVQRSPHLLSKHIAQLALMEFMVAVEPLLM
jgi:hypothetical protein